MANVAFFGTPDFSLPSLYAVHQYCQKNHHELKLVVTQPDKRQGRNQKLQSPVIKLAAEKLGLNIAQPSTLRKNTEEGDEFFDLFKDLDIDLAVVIAYGNIITPRLLALPKLGFVNIHGSILPQFRGAAPIQRAIMAKETFTGVTLMQMNSKMDEGDILAIQKTIIAPYETSEDLFRRLAKMGAHLLKDNLKNLLSRSLTSSLQDHVFATYAPKLTKDDGLITFQQKGQRILYQARACHPWPGAYAFFHEKRVKLFDGFFLKDSHYYKDKSPGEILSVNPYLAIKVLDGILFFKSIQFEGKKPLKPFQMTHLKKGEKFSVN